jgi:hypothetical protein
MTKQSENVSGDMLPIKEMGDVDWERLSENDAMKLVRELSKFNDAFTEHERARAVGKAWFIAIICSVMPLFLGLVTNSSLFIIFVAVCALLLVGGIVTFSDIVKKRELMSKMSAELSDALVTANTQKQTWTIGDKTFKVY